MPRLNRFTLIALALLDLSITAPAALNDTSITTYSNSDTNGLNCPVLGLPDQDAE